MKLVKQLLNNIKKDKKYIGNAGEDAAANYLKAKGMRILHRNWRHSQLEIDLICESEDTIVFVEVKTRKAQGITMPTEGINQRKIQSLLRAAKTWLSINDMWHRPCRFDVVGVVYDANAEKLIFNVEHYDNAFDISSIMGGGNSSWQPW